MDKMKYIAATLSRTKRKDYENYVVNRIYTLLDDLDIQPITQKYIKKSKGYVLIDLYFPQLNVGIEVDEKHHLKQEDEDQLRLNDILEEIKGYEEIRIKVALKKDEEGNITKYRGVEEINQDIKKAVKRIKKLKKQKKRKREFKKWITDPLEFVKNHDYISTEDDVEFSSNVEAAWLICGATKFAYNPRVPRCNAQLSYNKIEHMANTWIWFPILAKEIDGKLVGSSTGWINTVNDKWDEIYEKNDAANKNKKPFDKEIKRVVFMKYEDKIYGEKRKFIGVFQAVEEKNNVTTYKKVDEEFKIDKAGYKKLIAESTER